MKKLKILLTFIVAALIAVSQFSGVANAARPSYPFPSSYPYPIQTGQARHHIIPWQELTNYEFATYTTEASLTTFLTNYSGIEKANLGAYDNISALANGVISGKSDAKETMSELFAWMQGNLVVGPTNRQHDPGEKFDVVAYDCRQQKYPNPNYQDLKGRWENQAQKGGVFTMLSQTPMSGSSTAQCVGW